MKLWMLALKSLPRLRLLLSGHRGKPTSAERSWEVPGCTISRADNASQNGMTFQDVAGEAAVPDLVAYVEPRSVENSF